MREWKPGDVAMVNELGLALVRIRKEAAHNALEFVYVDGGFDMVDNLADGYIARPLVVIDPEDHEQVKRLGDALAEAFAERHPEVYGAAPDPADEDDDAITRQALRSLVAPPKPDEPTGLGAVVEDEAGIVWVLAPKNGRGDTEWVSAHSTNGSWPHIDAVKILSDGVQS